MDNTALQPDAPATLIWSSETSYESESPELRRDFDRLDQALKFLANRVPVGRRHTAWLITNNSLIPPGEVEQLKGRLQSPAVTRCEPVTRAAIG